MRRAEYPDPEALEVERRRREPDPPQEFPPGPTAWWMADRNRQARQEQQQARRREREEQTVTQQKRVPLVVVPRQQEQPDPGPWWDRAACKGEPLDRFFPEHGDGAATQKTFAANRELCRTCPVQTECLEDALSVSQARDFGFWGGTSAQQRRRLRRERRGAA